MSKCIADLLQLVLGVLHFFGIFVVPGTDSDEVNNCPQSQVQKTCGVKLHRVSFLRLVQKSAVVREKIYSLFLIMTVMIILTVGVGEGQKLIAGRLLFHLQRIEPSSDPSSNAEAIMDQMLNVQYAVQNSTCHHLLDAIPCCEKGTGDLESTNINESSPRNWWKQDVLFLFQGPPVCLPYLFCTSEEIILLQARQAVSREKKDKEGDDTRSSGMGQSLVLVPNTAKGTTLPRRSKKLLLGGNDRNAKNRRNRNNYNRRKNAETGMGFWKTVWEGINRLFSAKSEGSRNNFTKQSSTNPPNASMEAEQKKKVSPQELLDECSPHQDVVLLYILKALEDQESKRLNKDWENFLWLEFHRCFPPSEVKHSHSPRKNEYQWVFRFGVQTNNHLSQAVPNKSIASAVTRCSTTRAFIPVLLYIPGMAHLLCFPYPAWMIWVVQHWLSSVMFSFLLKLLMCYLCCIFHIHYSSHIVEEVSALLELCRPEEDVVILRKKVVRKSNDSSKDVIFDSGQNNNGSLRASRNPELQYCYFDSSRKLLIQAGKASSISEPDAHFVECHRPPAPLDFRSFSMQALADNHSVIFIQLLLHGANIVLECLLPMFELQLSVTVGILRALFISIHRAVCFICVKCRGRKPKSSLALENQPREDAKINFYFCGIAFPVSVVYEMPLYITREGVFSQGNSTQNGDDHTVIENTMSSKSTVNQKNPFDIQVSVVDADNSGTSEAISKNATGKSSLNLNCDGEVVYSCRISSRNKRFWSPAYRTHVLQRSHSVRLHGNSLSSSTALTRIDHMEDRNCFSMIVTRRLAKAAFLIELFILVYQGQRWLDLVIRGALLFSSHVSGKPGIAVVSVIVRGLCLFFVSLFVCIKAHALSFFAFHARYDAPVLGVFRTTESSSMYSSYEGHQQHYYSSLFLSLSQQMLHFDGCSLYFIGLGIVPAFISLPSGIMLFLWDSLKGAYFHSGLKGRFEELSSTVFFGNQMMWSAFSPAWIMESEVIAFGWQIRELLQAPVCSLYFFIQHLISYFFNSLLRLEGTDKKFSSADISHQLFDSIQEKALFLGITDVTHSAVLQQVMFLVQLISFVWLVLAAVYAQPPPISPEKMTQIISASKARKCFGWGGFLYRFFSFSSHFTVVEKVIIFTLGFVLYDVVLFFC